MTRTSRLALAAGCALGALTPGAVTAQTPDLEARLARLEAELGAVRRELAAEQARSAARDAQLETVAARPAPAPAPPAPAPGFRQGDTTVQIHGFIKTEALYSDFRDGDPATGALERDFYLPGATPVGGRSEGAKLDAHAKQTRLILTTATPIGARRLGAYLEADFQTAPGTQGDDRATNGYNFALRRAYLTFDRWTFGQDWTTFMNTATLAETADFIGATDGSAFGRQPVVRYAFTNGWVLALENPQTTVSTFATGARISADDSVVPDAVIRYNGKTAGGGIEYSLAALVRDLRYQGPGGVRAGQTIMVDDSTPGFGLSAAAKIKIGAKDDLRVMVTTGAGLGRYVGLNFTNDAAVTATGALDAIGLTGALAAYRHMWSERARSTLAVSTVRVDVDRAAMGLSANRRATSVFANLFVSPVKGLDLGVEVRYAERELESGLEGALTRVHLVAKQTF